MCVLLCVFSACVLGEGVEMSSWLDGHSFILLLLLLKKKHKILLFFNL